jgi:hypothetical protein
MFRRKKKKIYTLNNMKKILIILMMALAFQVNAQVKISALPAATEIDTADHFVIVAANGNVTRKLKALYLAQLVGDTAGVLRDFIWTRAPLSSPTFTGTVTLPSTTSIGNVSSTEIGYIDGVTSGIQAQLNLKAALAGPTFTGTVTLPSTTSIGNVSASELSSIDGITGNIQYLLDLKAPLANPTFTGTANFNQVVISGATIGFVTQNEIGFLDGVTDYIQNQFTNKAPLASPTFTGTVTLPSTTSIGNVSSTELGYIDGVTSGIQGQLGGKADTLKYYDFETDIVRVGTSTVVGSVAASFAGRFVLCHVTMSADLNGFSCRWVVPGSTATHIQSIKTNDGSKDYNVVVDGGECVIYSPLINENEYDELTFMIRLY